MTEGGNGTVSPESAEVALNDSFALTITPYIGYAVDTIKLDNISYVNNNQTVLPDNSTWEKFVIKDVTEDHKITVSFSISTGTDGIPDKYKYEVSAVAEEGGSASPETQLVAHGNDAIIDIDADANMAVDTITANGITYVNDGDAE